MIIYCHEKNYGKAFFELILPDHSDYCHGPCACHREGVTFCQGKLFSHEFFSNWLEMGPKKALSIFHQHQFTPIFGLLTSALKPGTLLLWNLRNGWWKFWCFSITLHKRKFCTLENGWRFVHLFRHLYIYFVFCYLILHKSFAYSVMGFAT